jgi:teichuronic acid exporter
MPESGDETHGLKRRAVRGALWVGLETWLSRLTSLVVFAVLGHLLSPKQFGLAAVANAVVAFLTLFVEQGLATALIQRERIDRRHENTVFFTSLASGFVCSAALFLSAPALAHVLRAPDATNLIRVVSPMFLFNAIEVVPSALLMRALDFKTLSLRRLAAVAVSSIVGLSVAAGGGGAYALVFQALSYSVCSCVVLLLASRWWPDGRPDFTALRDLRHTSVSAFGTNALLAVNDRADKLVVGALFGPVPLGLYTVAQRLVVVLSQVMTAALGVVALPLLSRLQGDAAQLRKTVRQISQAAATVSAPIFLTLAAMGGPLLVVLFGHQWASAGQLFQLFDVAALIGVFVMFDKPVLQAAGRASSELKLVMLATVGNAAAYAIGAPFGVRGVVLALTVRLALFWPVRVFVVTRCLELPFWTYAASWLVPMALAAVGATVAWLITDVTSTGRGATLIIIALVSPGLYLILLRAFARGHWDTLNQLVSGISRVRKSRDVTTVTAVTEDLPKGDLMVRSRSKSRLPGDDQPPLRGVGVEQSDVEISAADVGVVIPAYGRVSMTQELVQQFFAADDVPTVVVVDNGGDYEAVAHEVVVRPGTNTGWLRGTNLGTVAALDLGLKAVMWCNNDVTLSRDFVAGMCAALTPGVGAAAPCYDGQAAVQRRGYDGTVEQYEPLAVDHAVSTFDGTCVLVRADVLREVGLLDEARFARHGWGAIADVALRIRTAGWSVVVTERAFVHHFNKTTAREVNGMYESAAMAEMFLGLRAKYGRSWPLQFPDTDFTRAERFPYLRDRWRLHKAT